MNPNEYLLKFFAELERLVDGRLTRHAISMTRTGQLEIRLGGATGIGRHRSRSMTIRSGRHKKSSTLKDISQPASDQDTTAMPRKGK